MNKARVLLNIGVIALSAIFTISNAVATTNIKNLDIYTIQPWYTESQGTSDHIELPANITDRADLLPAAATYLQNKFPGKLNYIFSSKDEDIFTSNIISQLSANQIILWQGHGDWVDEIIALETGRDFDNSRLSNPTYLDDYNSNRIAKIPIGMGDLSTEGITPKYFDKYASQNLNNSLIFFGVCHSGHDDSLAQTLLNHGASTVVASTLTLQMDYGNIMQYEAIRLLSEINPNTNNYYTIGEALDFAKTEYGSIDPGSGGELVIFGDSNYRIADIIPDPELTPVIPLAPNTGSAI